MQRERISVSLNYQQQMKSKKAHHKSWHHFRDLKQDYNNEIEKKMDSNWMTKNLTLGEKCPSE